MTATQAWTGVSSYPSSSRSARLTQPRIGAINAVSINRCSATRVAAPAAASESPTRTASVCARSQASMVTSTWPVA